VLRAAASNTGSCQERCLTPPSSGRQKGCAFLTPLMSNVSRHMRSSNASGSAVSRSAVLRECAAWRSAVSSRKRQLAPPLCRAVRPAAAGAPIVEASPEQRSASCRLSVLRRPAHHCASASKSSAVCAATVNSSARRATLVLRPGPASTQRLRCFVLQPRPASAVRPMPAAVSVASVACKCRKRSAVATIAQSSSKTP
jgi:hypothetical protein